MEKDWVKIYTTAQQQKADLVLTLLQEHEIEVVKLNKQDSSYLRFGEVELYVHANQFQEAIEIIIRSEI